MGVFLSYSSLRKFYCCYFHCSQTFYHLHPQWLMNFYRKWVEAIHPPSFPSSAQWGISLDMNDCKHTKNSSDFHVSTYASLTVLFHIPAVLWKGSICLVRVCTCLFPLLLNINFTLSLKLSLPHSWVSLKEFKWGQDFSKVRVRNLAYPFPSINNLSTGKNFKT